MLGRQLAYNNNSLKPYSKQKGVALIMAMLIVALVTAISVEVSWRFDLDLARSGNRWHGMQAQAYLGGGENLAKVVLLKDLTESETQADHLQEVWATADAQFPTEEGYVSAKLEDAQGRFNLNLLSKPFKQAGGNNSRPLIGAQRYEEVHKRFIRLLQTVDLGEETFLELQQAEAILEAVIDWLDADSQVTGFGGAELSDYYSQLDPPITPTNGPMDSVSELLVIKGMLPNLYQGLLPFIIALPSTNAGDVMMNINTIGLNVARSFNESDILLPLTIEQGQSILDGILASPAETIEDISAITEIDQIFPPDREGGSSFSTDDLTVQSSYFLFFGEVGVGDHIKRSKSLLYRVSDSEVQTLRRTDANF